MISSLQTRLLLAVGVLAIAAVVAVALSARQTTRMEFRRFQEHEEERSSMVRSRDAVEIASRLTGHCRDANALREAASHLRNREIVLLVDEHGGLIARGGPGEVDLRDVRIRLAGDALTVEVTREQRGTTEGITLKFIGGNAPVVSCGDRTVATVHLFSIPATGVVPPSAAFLGSVDRRLLIATTIVGVMALGMTWVLARRIVGPLGELRLAARDLAGGDLSRRVKTRGSDEIAELGQSFNVMASELERQETLRRQLVHDIAHELRTPLTALRCRLETIVDGLSTDPRQEVAGASDEVRHLSRLVDDLQELAAAEARELSLAPTDVALADVALSAARAAGLEPGERLRVAVDASLRARADVVRVRQMLVNLFTNADRHTPAGGTITVRGSQDDGQAIFEVHNTGSSLEPDQLARVFERFYRADPARRRSTGGAGLGLAIVKHLVEAQGGRVWARSDASGVTFGFSLPEA
ncbi:MAG TPA: ATP-binding protein [Vicinamibacterales bacterium]|nr:ATP-binding protein [Vicinamibacterales bacterium]